MYVSNINDIGFVVKQWFIYSLYKQIIKRLIEKICNRLTRAW